MEWDEEAARVLKEINIPPTKTPIGIIGSAHLYGREASRVLCERIGELLAEEEDVWLITGGVSGVPETVSNAFWKAQKEPRGRVIHVLPHRLISFPGRRTRKRHFGLNVHAGKDFKERREILGRLASVYIVVEGGPGTEHEISIARSMKKPIIPVACSGAAAAKEWKEMDALKELESAWNDLQEHDKAPSAVLLLIQRFLHM